MNDFDDFARNERLSLDSKQKSHDEAVKAAADARNEAYFTGQHYLLGHVMPRILEAKAAFEKYGLRINVVNNWDKSGLFTTPEVKVVYYGRKKRPHDDSFYEVPGPSVVITHDGSTLSIFLSDNEHGLIGSRPSVGRDLNELDEFLKSAAKKMFDKLDPNHT